MRGEVTGERGDAGIGGVGELVQPGVEGVSAGERLGLGEGAKQRGEFGPCGRNGAGVDQHQHRAVEFGERRTAVGQTAQYRRHPGRHRRVGM
ncbi:hypothetical protein [Pseudonocardia asaccharolytica]|uniref:Uncharacterized protein n=1 Tax=Pseudonocardia asaccharolytica DSM 44247 = NBRC 16224 TaxID=1123024 RepID=A0A511DB36_9PSEU|nr:hypothetical protein [Pseudonocardia asaccharolytica]GEL20158.1 hypothetical protein PA7_39950 [Pseudonocardia asaccharolytica DSM 44247 = NBRC 16224]